MERLGEAIVAGLLMLMLGMHPHAAAGAAFGCFFFLASPASTNRRQRLLLAVFSFGIGYAAGVFVYGGGPPYSEKAMVVAASVSALAAGSCRISIRNLSAGSLSEAIVLSFVITKGATA